MDGADAPFFVVGNDRSGTTVLRLVLDRSAEAAVPPESMFLLDFEPVRCRGGLEDPEKAARFLAEVWRHPRVQLWGLRSDPPPLPSGLSHADAYRFVVEAPFRAYALREGKKRFGDKTPAYLHAVDELLAVWPEARFVVLVRDARAVARSIQKLPFGPNNPYAAAAWWARGIREGHDAERRHPEQVLTVRYEDLVSDPEATVRRVCDHVRLGYNSEMLAIERAGPEKIVSEQADWYTGVSKPISAEASSRWRTEMPEADRRVVEAVAGPELRVLGYETGDGVVVVPRSRALAYSAHDTTLRAVNAFRLRIVQERGRELRYVLRRKLAGARG
jgi:Sulfotransferase family